MLKQWFRWLFLGERILLENILIELRNMHYHLDRIDGSSKEKPQTKKKEER